MSDVHGIVTTASPRTEAEHQAYQRVGLEPSEYASVEGAVLAVLAVLLFVMGAIASNGALLVLSGVATLAAVGFTLAASIRSLSAPTPTE